MLPPEIEKLFELAKNNPAGFQTAADALIEAAIKKIAGGDRQKEARLRAQQWALETRLSRCKNPTVRFAVMQKLFWEQVHKFRGCIDLSKK